MENFVKGPVGKLAQEWCKKRLPLTVMKSQKGYYIGTFDGEGPCSRESVEYWPTSDQAQHALVSGNWTQKDEP